MKNVDPHWLVGRQVRVLWCVATSRGCRGCRGCACVCPRVRVALPRRACAAAALLLRAAVAPRSRGSCLVALPTQTRTHMRPAACVHHALSSLSSRAVPSLRRPDDEFPYAGTVDSYNPDNGEHCVVYVDGQEEWLTVRDATHDACTGFVES
jgi:hypothetical protein